MSFPLGHLLPGYLAGRQGQVHNLGRNARIGSDWCHPETYVSQGLFSPDSLAGAVPQRALAVGTAGCLPTSLGGFQNLKASPSQVSRPHGLAGSLCGMCDAKERSEGWGTTSWSNSDSLPFLCVWPEISLSIAWVSPSPVINHNPPCGGWGQAGSSVLLL